MKVMKNLVKDMIPTIEPDRVVHAIYSRNGLEPLPEPLESRQIVCPTCGSPKGYYNAFWRAWCCRNDSCWGPHPKDGQSAPSFPPKLFPAQFCIPSSHATSSMKDIKQLHDLTCKLKNWSSSPNGFMLFAGPSGVGKTYAAVACMDHYYKETKKLSCRFVNYNDLYYSWKDCARQFGDDLDIIEKYKDLDLVVIDDFGTRPPSEGYLEFIYQFIHRRGMSTGGTVITTNLSRQEIVDQYNDRILSRISSGEIIKFVGNDRRIKKDF